MWGWNYILNWVVQWIQVRRERIALHHSRALKLMRMFICNKDTWRLMQVWTRKFLSLFSPYDATWPPICPSVGVVLDEKCIHFKGGEQWNASHCFLVIIPFTREFFTLQLWNLLHLSHKCINRGLCVGYGLPFIILTRLIQHPQSILYSSLSCLF